MMPTRGLPMPKLLTIVAAVAIGTAVAPASAADFYAGKTIRIVVSSAPGGGYDAYARTLAQHLRKHIPGDPTIVVQNMPGAGGTVATNWLFNVAPKDGTVFGVIQRGDRKSTRLNSSHSQISYAVFCLKKKKKTHKTL